MRERTCVNFENFQADTKYKNAKTCEIIKIDVNMCMYVCCGGLLEQLIWVNNEYYFIY